MSRLQTQIADPMNRYQAGLAVASVGLLAAFVSTGFQLSSPLAVAGLALTAAIAERVRVRLGTEMEASISLVPTVFTAVLFGPVAAMLVAGASFLADFPPLLRGERREMALARGRPFLKWGIYTCTRALTGGAAGIAAAAVVTLFDSAVAGVTLATLVAAFIAEPLDVGFVALTMKFRGLRSIEALRALAPVTLASIPLYTPVIAVLCIAYRELSAWTLPLFFVPALAAQRLFALYQQQRRLTDDLVGVNARLEAVNLSFASALVATLDARDRYTAGHSAAVA
ncbi:MAG TPA: hypothetical protein VIU86_00800, partial [Gaiellaceae bacterium]